MPDESISVVIPTRNRWHLLQRTLAGALAQEGVEVEVVVVDDGSTDGTAERLAALDDGRVRVLRNERALGVSAARNRGVEAAEGEWIAFLDDDDVWAPDKLCRQLAAAGAAAAPFAYTTSVIVDPAMAVLEVQPAPDPAEVLVQTLSFCAIPGGCSNVVARRDLTRAAGGFNTELTTAEDWDMWIRMLLEAGGAAARCEAPLYGYVLHPANSVLVNRQRTRTGYGYIRRRYAGVRRAHGVEMDEVGLARWTAGNYRRVGDRRGAIGVYMRSAWKQRNAGNLLRASALVFGESAMERVSGRATGPAPTAAESWLEHYRPGGSFAGADPLAGVRA